MLSRLVFVLALAPALACAAELPDSFHFTPEVLHLRINGLTVNSREFISNLEPTNACALLERHWQQTSNGGQSALCQLAGRWLLISRRAGKVLQTAQLEGSGDGSHGFLSEFDPLASLVAKNRPQLPLPVGARLVNAVQSVLDHDSVTQFTIELPWTPAASLMRLRKVAHELGWNSVAGSGASIVDFQRGELAARAVAVSSARGCILALVEHQPAASGP